MRRYFFGLAMMALAMMSPAILRADDSQIARQIIERLQVEKRAGNLKGFNIDLQVDEGTVWMSGKLATEQQRAKALDIARRIPGVKQVVNDLKVAGDETKKAAPTKKETPKNELPDDSVPSDATETAAKPSPASGLMSGLKPAFWSSRRDKSSEATNSSEEATEVKPVSGATAIGTGVTPSQVQAAPAPYYAPTARPTPQATPVASAPSQLTTGQTPPRPAVAVSRSASPVPMNQAGLRQTQYEGQVIYEGGGAGPSVGPNGEPCPMYGGAAGPGPMRYDAPNMPGYAWPSYAAYPNYAAVQYPKQYSPTVWPYIGPFYPYPQVPMGWRKVTLEWDDGWWFLDFKDSRKVAHGRW